MSKQTFTYKGYEGSVEFSIDDRVLHGKILFIRDMISYEADTLADLEHAFHEAVDEYVADCQVLGVEPNKPYSGTFNIRIGKERHRALAVLGFKTEESINELVGRAIDALLKYDGKPNSITHVHVTVDGQVTGRQTVDSQMEIKKQKGVWKGSNVISIASRT